MKYDLLTNSKEKDVFAFFNSLNEESFHKMSNDDICTSMNLVKIMLDYIPNVFWQNKDIKVLDPCCGNGNFGAYCMFKTDLNTTPFNDT